MEIRQLSEKKTICFSIKRFGLFCKTATETLLSHHMSYVTNNQMLLLAQTTKTGSSWSIITTYCVNKLIHI